MPRTKKPNSRTKIQISNDWNKEHLKSYTIKFNLDTQRDVIEQLESKPNKTGYIADLIRQDLIAQGKQPYEALTLSKLAEEMDSEDQVMLVFPDGSQMRTSKEKIENDNRLVSAYVVDKINNVKYWVVNVRYS